MRKKRTDSFERTTDKMFHIADSEKAHGSNKQNQGPRVGVVDSIGSELLQGGLSLGQVLKQVQVDSVADLASLDVVGATVVVQVQASLLSVGHILSLVLVHVIRGFVV